MTQAHGSIGRDGTFAQNNLAKLFVVQAPAWQGDE
jgi:hypothetical protein